MKVHEMITKLRNLNPDIDVVVIAATDGLGIDPREPEGYVLVIADGVGAHTVLAIVGAGTPQAIALDQHETPVAIRRGEG